MSKRFTGNFPRVERDYYGTPAEAVAPLAPYLRRDNVHTFYEPCRGQDRLKLGLETHGFTCSYAGDIAFGQDALKLTTADLKGADCGVTNPPYRRPEDKPRTKRLLADLTQHFLDLGVPFWLLVDTDWMANLAAVPFLPWCRDIVMVGRIQWYPGSKSTSSDNFAWYGFDPRTRDFGTAVHNNRVRGKHRYVDPFVLTP